MAHTSNRAVKWIKHNGKENALVTDGKHSVRVAYGDVRGYITRNKPIEAVHYFGSNYEALYMKIKDTLTNEIKYYHGVLDHRLDPDSKPGGSRRNSVLLQPVGGMSFGMALLDYVLSGGKLK